MRSSNLTKLVIGFSGMTLVLLALTSCQTTGSSGTNTASWCTVFKPITWSSKDTLETAKQVREHNAAWVAVCVTKK